MIDVYYLKNGNSICLPNEFEASIPLHLKEKLENINHTNTALEKRKLLYLLYQILKTDYPNLNLVDLHYNEIGKPYLSNNNLVISNAYSANILVTALSINKFIGLDAEKVLPVNLADYQFYFTKNEWAWMNNDLIKFYTLWTKKEALAKALGIGMDLPFDEIELLGDEICYGEKNFYFVVKIILGDYVISTASNVKDEISFKEMIL
jgi:4'-phosphopantetheinyl transferase